MRIVESTRQKLAGMQKVEAEILERLKACGIPKSAVKTRWNHDRSLAELPSIVHMEMQVGDRSASVDWSEIYLQDSAERIERWEVQQQIESVIHELAPEATRP